MAEGPDGKGGDGDRFIALLVGEQTLDAVDAVDAVDAGRWVTFVRAASVLGDVGFGQSFDFGPEVRGGFGQAQGVEGFGESLSVMPWQVEVGGA